MRCWETSIFAMNKFSRLYQKNSIESLSPGRIILLLFNTALQCLNRVRESIHLEFSVKNQEVFHNNLQKTENIIQELQSSLNFQHSKELADTLFRLYDYVCDQLTIVRTKQSLEHLSNAEQVLKELRDGWSEMLQKREKTSDT